MTKLAIIGAFVVVLGLSAQSGGYDYFLLSLSWAPGFCAEAGQAAKNPAECATGRSIGFVVHGLWPEANAGKSPESCGKATTVNKAVLSSILPYMPSASLVQHEWAAHGTCSGLSQTAYFGDVMAARSAVQIPVQFTSLEAAVMEGPEQIEAQFAAANPSFPEKAFRTSCKAGDLAEVRVCFDKNLKPQECTASAGECSAATMQIRAPR